MKALLEEGGRVQLAEIAAPAPRAHEAIVRVAIAGICRTDLYAADGRLPSATREPRILGHEFSGTIASLGRDVTRVRAHDRVAIMPLVPCGVCPGCLEKPRARCASRRMLGVDLHGAFAELVAVPEECLFVLPERMSFLHAAYVEPVAASLAPAHAGLDPASRGVIFGRNRIAQLTARILNARGFSSLAIHDPALPLARASLDFVVETVATAEGMQVMIDALRPGGTLVLKSRPPVPVAIDVAAAVKKDLRLIAVSYAPFEDAIAILADRRVEVADLLGRSYPLEEFEAAFAAARTDETAKLFLEP